MWSQSLFSSLSSLGVLLLSHFLHVVQAGDTWAKLRCYWLGPQRVLPTVFAGLFPSLFRNTKGTRRWGFFCLILFFCSLFNPSLKHCTRSLSGNFFLLLTDSQQNVCFRGYHFYFVAWINVTICEYAGLIFLLRKMSCCISSRKKRKIKMRTWASFQLKDYSLGSLGQCFGHYLCHNFKQTASNYFARTEIIS